MVNSVEAAYNLKVGLRKASMMAQTSMRSNQNIGW